MEKNLSLLEELNIEENIKTPHLSYVVENLMDRKRVALSVFRRSNEEVVLIDCSGFLIDSVFAGLTEKHLAHIAITDPQKYKESLWKILQDKGMMQGVFEIAKSMDEDLGENVTQNQNRVKNIIQYIKDNRITFEF